MPSWRKVVVSGSDANLKSLVVSESINAQSFTGSLYGTASYADFTLSSSYVTQSNYVTQSATASYVEIAQTASYVDPNTYTTRISTASVLGTAIDFNNLRLRISSAGSCSVQLKAISGSMTIDGMDQGGVSTVNQVTRVEGLTLNSTYKYVNTSTNLANPGDSQLFTFIDRSTGSSYRVTALIGYNYEKNLISIEKLV